MARNEGRAWDIKGYINACQPWDYIIYVSQFFLAFSRMRAYL